MRLRASTHLQTIPRNDSITSKRFDHPDLVYPAVIALLFPMASAAMPLRNGCGGRLDVRSWCLEEYARQVRRASAVPGSGLGLKRRMQTDGQQNWRGDQKDQRRNNECSYQYPGHGESSGSRMASPVEAVRDHMFQKATAMPTPRWPSSVDSPLISRSLRRTIAPGAAPAVAPPVSGCERRRRLRRAPNVQSAAGKLNREGLAARAEPKGIE